MNIKEKLASASKKERTPQQQKAMTILNWVATAVCIVVIVFALVVAIFTIAGTTNDDHLMRFGDKIYLNVASDSMEPTFSTSDVIIANAFNYEKQLAELKVGQVVTFKTTVRSGGNTYEVFNTHRIVRINFEENGTTVRNFTTRGDNSKSADKDNSKLSWKDAIAQNTLGLTETVAPSNIVATWGSVDAGQFHVRQDAQGRRRFLQLDSRHRKLRRTTKDTFLLRCGAAAYFAVCYLRIYFGAYSRHCKTRKSTQGAIRASHHGGQPFRRGKTSSCPRVPGVFAGADRR